MENGKLVRKNVAAGRRLRPLRHTRQMSAQPTNDDSIDTRKDKNDQLDSIDAYIEHVSLENGTNDNNHAALHSALQSLKGRVHHARAQSVKRSQSKQRQGDGINKIKKSNNTNTSFASTTTPKTCSITESVMPLRNEKHHLFKTNSVGSSNSSNIVSKEFLSASMPLHNMKDNSDTKSVGRMKLRRSINNSKQATAPHVKEHNAWHDKTTEANNINTMTTEEKENKISSNTNEACHVKRSKTTVVTLQKRSSAPEKNMTHTTNHSTDHVEQNQTKHEYKWEQNDMKNEDADESTNVVLPLAPHDMDEEYYTNKANWETNLPEHVIQLLEGEKLLQTSQYHEESSKKLSNEKENAENDWYHNVNGNKHKSGYFSCIRCHTPICALHNQMTLPETLSLLLQASYNTNTNNSQSIESNDKGKNQCVAFRCIDHHAITLTLSTAIHGRNKTDNYFSESKRANNEELHIMVHCVHCNGCLGELVTMYDDSECELEVNDVTYVFVAQRACLQYMPFRTQHELDTPIDLMLCCNDDEDDNIDEYVHDKNKYNKQHNQKKYNKDNKRKEALDIPDDELFQLSWHSSDIERDVFYLSENDDEDDDGYM